MSRFRTLLAAVLTTLTLTLTACSSRSSNPCSTNVGVASFTLQFRNGLDNFSEDQYSQLRSSTQDVLQVVEDAQRSPNNDVKTASKSLSTLIQNFERRMESFDWDISQAIVDSPTNEAADALATSQSLKLANMIESYVIETCGMPSTLDPGSEPIDTLPMPSIPAPTATDPPMNTIKEQSEDIALGTTVANLFKLTLTSQQVQCLGAALQGISDDSSRWTTSTKYQQQFKTAFDTCSIPFVVSSS